MTDHAPDTSYFSHWCSVSIVGLGPHWRGIVAAALLTVMAACSATDMVDENPGSGGKARIELSPGSMSLLVGEALTYVARYYDSSGSEVETSFTWVSEDPSVASVTSSGQVTALSPGQTAITASANNITSSEVKVTVVASMDAVATIAVTPSSATIDEQGQQQFSAVAKNLSGNEVQTSFVWQSSNESVATIDAAGLAMAVGPGNTSITASAEGVASAPAQLTVQGDTRSGQFQGNPDSQYTVTGTATLRQRADGSLVLEFSDDFVTDSGPGLDVFFSTSDKVTSSSVVVGDLQSESGAQSYGVPSTVSMTSHPYVVIHCVPFNVTFGAALLTD